jgi:hypothetical protein
MEAFSLHLSTTSTFAWLLRTQRGSPLEAGGFCAMSAPVEEFICILG